MEISVLFDGFNNWGTLSLLEKTLDPYLYPTLLDAKYQQFEHVDDEYLLITGVHKDNPKIGKYEVKVYPLEDS